MFSTALSRSGYSPVATAAAMAQPRAPVSFASTVSTGSFMTSANICAQTVERAAPPARRIQLGRSLRLFSSRSRCMRWQKAIPSYTLRARCFRLWFSDMPFTLRALIQRLRALQGNEDATAWVEEFLLHAKTDLSTAEEMRSARKIIDNMIPANLELQFDFETVVPDITAWYGCATLYSGKSILQVDSTVDPTELSWLTDEDSGVLTDEYGIILFE